MSNINYVVGIVVGVIIGLILLKICNRDNKVKTEYDERQQVTLGKSYKYACNTTWILLSGLLVLDVLGIFIPATNAVVFFTVALIGVLVHTTYAIFHDAYFGNNSNVKKYFGVMLIVLIIDAICSVLFIVEGNFWENGMLNEQFITIEITVGLLLCMVLIFLRSAKSKGDEEE